MTFQETVISIETELDRLDASDSETNSSGICVYAEDDLPRGWVRLSDGTGEAYGPADDVLAALQAVEYDSEKIVRYEPNYGHEGEHPIYENGWELAWDALAFEDDAPASSRDWPSDLIKIRQIEEGCANDNPITLITVETNAGTRYAAGPHGVSCCALSDLLSNGGTLAETEEQAISECGDYEEDEDDEWETATDDGNPEVCVE